MDMERTISMSASSQFGRRIGKTVGVMLVCVSAAYSQGGGAIAKLGYSEPERVIVAPGQVVTIFATGFSDRVSAPVLADGRQAVTSLGGVSAVLSINGGIPAKLPVLALRSVSPCIRPDPDCATYTAVTVQLPYDIPVNRPYTGAAKWYAGMLSVSDNGAITTGIVVNPVPDSIHVLSGCDVAALDGSTCIPTGVVRHSDGARRVTNENPARPGEEVTVYAFGAGATSPPVAPGQATPEGTYSARQTFRLLFDFRPNAGASPCREAVDCGPSTQANASLVPGSVGLYAIRVKVPPVPAQLVSCDSAAPGVSVISSNLTITVVGATSYDAAPICVSAK
jgi:hypothetical protein